MREEIEKNIADCPTVGRLEDQMIDGFSISGYRSFGQKQVFIQDLSKINVFIGKNNCGKSNILRFVHLIGDLSLKRSRNEMGKNLDPLLDFCLTDSSRKIEFGLQFKRDSFTAESFDKVVQPFGSIWGKLSPEITDSFWFSYKAESKMEPSEMSLENFSKLILKRYTPTETENLTSILCSYTGGSQEKRANDISITLHQKVTPKFDVRYIEAFRKISESGSQVSSGSGLIKELRKLQSPELADYENAKQRFLKITNFIRSILGEPDAKLEIPAEKDEILVSIKNKVLPLDSLGTGIHELIIIAASVTLVDGVLFCIEEPEIHLHPELQKKFVNYIASETKNQYFIASHSNAFFDLPGVNIYSCYLDNGNTKCCLVSTAAEKHAVLMDLGYRPSDLLQANFIIWVERPSDRIYINHWIKAKEPELIEGLHYAIMFYGGRLLSHLSYENSLVNDFIRLSCLNRNACIVIDSDKKTAHSQINDTKKRITKDFQSYDCLTWITKGRSIENYVSETLLNSAFAVVHPMTHKIVKWEQFSDLTRIQRNKTVDKVAVARVVTENEADFNMLDLDKIMNKLIDRIKKHNV